MTYIYETMYILRPDLGEERVGQAIAKYQNYLQEQGAQDVEVQHRGKRRLAQLIKKQRDGIYVQMNYRGNGSLVAGLERSMRLSEEVIRYLTIHKQETPEVPPEPEEAEISEN